MSRGGVTQRWPSEGVDGRGFGNSSSPTMLASSGTAMWLCGSNLFGHLSRSQGRCGLRNEASPPALEDHLPCTIYPATRDLLVTRKQNLELLILLS